MFSKSDEDIVNPNLTPVQLPRARYVLWNIYQINNLFNTYYTGLSSPMTCTSLILTYLCSTSECGQ